MMEPIGAVLVVLGLLMGLLWLVRRPTLGRGASGRYLLVLDTASITAGQSLALVRVAGRCLLVGASSGRMEKLAEFPATELRALESARSPGVKDPQMVGRSIWRARHAAPLRWLAGVLTWTRQRDQSASGSAP